MTLKARRLVEELVEVFMAAPDCLPDGWRERAGAAGSARHGCGRARLYRRDDRPLCRRRARPPLQADPLARMNPFDDILSMLRSAIRRLQARGGLPADARRSRGSWSSRPATRAMAMRRPMPPWCWPRPRPLEADGAGRATGRSAPGLPDIVEARAAPPGFVNPPAGTLVLAAADRDRARRRRRLRAHRRGPGPAGQCGVLLGQPDRPAACRDTAAARSMATRWPISWRMSATP